MPTLYILAGPNGVGKTTFANNYLPNEARQLEFVNADLIARGLSPYDPEAVAVEAGKTALRRTRDLISQRISFTWETTMSGRSAVVWLRAAREKGYEVKAYFLWVRDPEILLRRIRKRVVEGGHNISEEVLRRRFLKTIQNFLSIYRSLFHTWKLFENDRPAPRLIVVGKAGRVAVRDRVQLARILKEADIEL